MKRKRKASLKMTPISAPMFSSPMTLPAKKMSDFREGYFSIKPQDLKSQGIDSETIETLVNHYQYYKEMSNSGLGFIGEWGYWMMMQSYGLYKDSFSYFKKGNSSLPSPLLRVNGKSNIYPVHSCCFLPGKKSQKVRDSYGNILQSVFPYTCNWDYGATPDMYIGPRLDFMTIEEFKKLQNPFAGQGYRIIEIKTVSKIFNEFVPQKDEKGNILINTDGHYIPMKDGNGCNVLTGKKIVKVQINAHTHQQGEELVVIAKRSRRNDAASHLGFITISELEKLRRRSDLKNTNCIRLDWLHPSTEEFIEEIKERCRMYKIPQK